MKNIIAKGEYKFWFAIIGFFVAGVVAFTTLKGEVGAMTSREQANKTQFMIVVETVEEIKDTVARMETNQKHIMRELGISVD